MAGPLDLSLIEGPIPVTATVVAALALAYLAIRRNRTWWTRVLPVVVSVCALVVTGATLVVDHVWKPWPEPLPPVLAVWSGAVLVASALAVLRLRSGRWYGRVLGVVLAAAVAAGGLVAANAYFGQYPNTRAVLDVFRNDRVDLDAAAPPPTDVVEVPAGKRLADVWRRPAGLPDRGTVSEVTIPGALQARPAWVYLPPAYHATPRPRLPVVVLMAGQPGSPRDWFDGGRLADNLDAYARGHDGLAPVVVVADQLGKATANPLCLDSALGRAETYLARDVPAWIERRLTVDERREAWTVAGFSHGATCSVQLAVRASDVYGNFIALAPQGEPTLGTRQETVKAAFGGDEAAFTRVNPLDILAGGRFPGTAGVIVAGRDDGTYRQADAAVFEACRKAGMDVLWNELPNGHDWNLARQGLFGSLPWLAARTGLVG
ncbi:alpha/beta hydrolase-fold protein [Saccharothrix violaceirubra]|uniref:S-formylglutathione hydrolase FrmB/multisubunit Na+/H+ antiporter MnhB subunit n=1 Tax=Saccharothrix violaceirubra TaxID=413306 RepID=A0A7W7T7I1_9PSEU|nr:alpha/beta hydrolase-fold protein [Saccharothrix violaceirubra]MBB4967452.1 S-formylglutathione hydrolase FrmB/multisubunit Na+/H+ antiporter MnhB subunit [Saccharothrix violaceirubra]